MLRPRGVFAGLVTLDVAHRVERTPGPDEKVTASGVTLAAGGPAANAAVAFAALGGDATLVTALGHGDAADLVRRDLEDHGVRVVDVSPPGTPGPSAVSAIAVSPLGRSVVGTDTAGSPAFEADDGVLRLLDAAHVLLVDGHHPGLAVPLARRAATAGIPVVVDAGRWKPAFGTLAELPVDLVCSEGLRAPGTVDGEGSARALLAVGAAHVVVATAGAGDVRWWWPDGGAGRCPVPQVDAVDTLGAGDAFHGGYAFARARGDGVARAVELGVAVAERRVVSAGPRDWLRTLGGLASVPTLVPSDSETRAAPTGVTLEELLERAGSLAIEGGPRRILGIAGAPGAGKSTLAARVVAALGPQRAVLVPMDGFHLSNAVLRDLGRRERKGAPDTFDAAGYLALLRRVRAQEPGHAVVLAPTYDRTIEEAIAGAIAVAPEVPLVVTEGNYLLLDAEPWRAICAVLDEVWFLAPEEDVRRERLIARHVEHGKAPEVARRWALGTDECNARAVAESAWRADAVVRVPEHPDGPPAAM